jgi:hypothetical protein
MQPADRAMAARRSLPTVRTSDPYPGLWPEGTATSGRARRMGGAIALLLLALLALGLALLLW